MSNPKISSVTIEDQLCERDFGAFCEIKLGQKLGSFHKQIADSIVNSDKDIVVQAARGHFKSTVFSKCFPLWQFWRTNDRKLEISIQSHNMTQARKEMDILTAEIEQNDLIRDRLYPDDIYKATWSGNHIKTRNGHQMYCRAFGHRGDHVDFSIVDDPLQDADAGSSKNMDTLKQTFWSAVYPITKSRRGKHIVIGTPMSLDDLYADLESKPGFTVLKFPAVIEDSRGEWLAAQFPEHFTLDDLRLIRENMPSWSWEREYMLRPVGDSNALFPIDVIRKCIELPYENNPDEKNVQYYMGCDIALSDSDRADYSCFVIVARVPGKPIKVIDKFLGKGINDEEQLRIIKEKHNFFRFSKIIIEKVGLSTAMVNKIVSELPGVVEEFKTSKSTKDQIIGNLELMMRNQMLKLPDDKDLISELSCFGIKTRNGKQTIEALSGHDDQVIALALACYASGGWIKKYVPTTLTII